MPFDMDGSIINFSIERVGMKKLIGTIPVLITPFDESGDVDTESLKRVIEYLMTYKIGGLWVLGTGSEDMNLTFSKRLKVAQAVCESVSGRVPIVLGAGFFAFEDTIRFFRETMDLCADYYHVMPYHPLISSSQLERYYLRLAEIAPSPLWLYTSGNWSQQLPLNVIGRLKCHPNIAGIKFSNRITTDLQSVIAMADDVFQVVTAVARQTATCYMLGSQAHTSSIASVVPGALNEIYELVHNGRFSEAIQKQNEFNLFMDQLPLSIKKDNFLGAAEEKYMLSLLGLCKPYTSFYYRDLDEGERKQVEDALLGSSYLRGQLK
ncbi:TPA: dihydrodipicolinate synthase family protein [Legionella pneumophila]|nr:dihydrodipicolinate synthase family protein [Legionella pneumophila subsp. fraseri]MDX1845284.1 dihydrodipicolinate synthase family protein [Legionella pneumophila subsp. fraseri]HBJ7671529.1 dihydrodipicolinate synthase family protein [Legionella pneumophila]HBJ7684333.1 dihydrodipicolinate synthase family protein [Legionella pneumophila]